MTTPTRIAIAALLSVLAGCVAHLKPPPPPPMFCADVVLSNPQRAAALVSVHYHSEAPLVAVAPIEILNLPAAVKVLGCDEGDAAELRRRRAVAKLAAIESPVVNALLPQLRVSPADFAAIADLLHAFPSATPKIVKETAIYRYLFWKYRAISGCIPTYPVTTVTRTGDTVEGTTRFWVNRSVAVLKAPSDPQNWEKCSAFFENSYVPNTTSSYPADCAAPKPPKKGTPPAPGTTWSDQLFEHFTFSVTQSWFRNLLSISSYSVNFGSGQFYGFNYSLGHPICSSALTVRQDRGLNIDGGHLYAYDGGLSGWSSIEATKNVEFDARVFPPISKSIMADYAQILMQAMGAEATTMACCKPKKILLQVEP